MKSHILTPMCLLVSLAVYSQQKDSAKSYFNKAVEEKNAKRYLVASNYLDKATQFDPTFTAAYLENAFVNLEMRRTDMAKAHFTKVYELEPTNIVAIRELADLYYSYRQFQKAIIFATKCTGCQNSERIIAMCSYEQEDYALAIEGLLKVLAKNPADAEATYTLARCYLDNEEYKKAVPYYRKAIELDPSRNAWMYELGLLYYNNNDYKNSVTYILLAGKNGYPESNDFNENLGYAYIYSGDFDNGEKLLLKILAKKPGNKDLMRDIAEAYYNQKMYDKSLEYCQKLMEINMQDAKALYQAGMCFQKKGDKSRGQQMCDKAIEMDPSLSSMRQKNMSMGL